MLSVRRHVALLLGAWWMADYETVHVCRVPWCQQCVKIWCWPSNPIKLKKLFIVLLCPFEYMSPYCSARDEWLIMKRCMYVGYHDVNNVSNFGGDPMTQLNSHFFYSIILSVRRYVAILFGTWWMTDYETLHVCRVPWCQQCVKCWWWP